MSCQQCPSDDHNGEWYRFWTAVFDVQLARTFIKPDRQVYTLTEENLRALSLPLEPSAWKTDEDGRP